VDDMANWEKPGSITNSRQITVIEQNKDLQKPLHFVGQAVLLFFIAAFLFFQPRGFGHAK
jgi:hypothetical protein